MKKIIHLVALKYRFANLSQTELQEKIYREAKIKFNEFIQINFFVDDISYVQTSLRGEKNQTFESSNQLIESTAQSNSLPSSIQSTPLLEEYNYQLISSRKSNVIRNPHGGNIALDFDDAEKEFYSFGFNSQMLEIFDKKKKKYKKCQKNCG